MDPSRWFAAREKSDAEKELERQQEVLRELKGNLSVRRVLRTYVLAIEYTSPDPSQAALIANAFAEAYLTDQLDAKYDATRRASGWMQARIAKLKEEFDSVRPRDPEV